MRALVVLVLVLLGLLPGLDPMLRRWIRDRFRGGETPSWERVIWITGTTVETPDPSWADRLEQSAPEYLVWNEAPLPAPGPRRVLRSREAPPGGGRLLEELPQWRGSLTETLLTRMGRELPDAGLLLGAPRVDFSRVPGELSVDLVEANRESLRGKILVVGAAENLNGPPTPLGPVPAARAVAQGLLASLEGGLYWPLRKLWVALLALGLARWTWERARRRPLGHAVLPVLGALLGVGLLARLLLVLGLLVPPLPFWLALVGAVLAAPREVEQDRLRLLGEVLARVRGEPDWPLSEALELLPEELRGPREALYTFLRDPSGPPPRGYSSLEACELVALDEALETRGESPERRQEVLEWACLKAPEDEAIRARFQACLEEISVGLALLDVESILEAVDPRYQDLELAGQGAMGLVLRGRDVALERPVALKVVNPSVLEDEDITGRFWREIEALSSFTHPHIVQIYGVHPGRIPYYVMEFLPGRTLKDALEAGDLAPAERLRALEHFAEALDHIHSRGIIHRDLKPENLVLVEEGGALERLVMIDFGVAKGPSSRPLTQAGDILGTLSYMAPEQVRGADVDAAADRFAYGAIAYEVLTGARPFKNPYQAGKQDPPPLEPVGVEVSEACCGEVLALLSREPGERPGDLGCMRDLLREDLFSNNSPEADSLIHEEGATSPEEAPREVSRGA